ncbi:MAG: RNA polymerase sporulation sigma factor SigK [Bacilli bacterium]|nr:RNA polymerase sporulation sigma factor SigK [Bacilli bacterium]
MLKRLLKLLTSLKLFTASYSNNVFPDPLSKDEEEKYIEEALKGNVDARNKLIEHNLRLVAHIVKKYDTKEDPDDLISIGTIGLIKGIDSFSNDKGVKLTTYCARCIENEILMFFRSNNKNLKNISLNEKVGYDKDGNEIMILDILKAPIPDMIEEINKNDNIKLLKNYLTILTPREKEIIIRRYGLNNKDEQTQKLIAKQLHISRSYVSRIEKRALTKILKEFIKNKSID